MNPAVQAVICGRRRQQVTQTFTSNATWTAPITTSRIESASGKGSDGSAATIATVNNLLIDTIQGVASGIGSTSGSLSWPSFNDAALIVAGINNGTQGSGWNGVNYTGHPNSNTYDISIVSGVIAASYIQGSASASYSAGWKMSGAVLASDYGQSFISYQYNVPPTNGTAATAFGKTFPGGTAGPASVTPFSNLVVTPGASYSIVVPAGGSLTITYFQ